LIQIMDSDVLLMSDVTVTVSRMVTVTGLFSVFCVVLVCVWYRRGDSTPALPPTNLPLSPLPQSSSSGNKTCHSPRMEKRWSKILSCILKGISRFFFTPQQRFDRVAMSSGHSASFSYDAEALRAQLDSLDIDPGAFADLPHDMQVEMLQTIPRLGQSVSPASAGGAGGESSNQWSQSLGLREQLQDGQRIHRDREEMDHDSRYGSVNSTVNGSDYESDLEQYEAAPQHGPIHRDQSHAEPTNPNLDPDVLQLLQQHGIDAHAFVGMPDDIQSEILMMLSDVEDSASQLSAGSEGGGGGGAGPSAFADQHEHVPYMWQQPAPVGFSATVVTPPSSSERPILSHTSPVAAPFPSDSRVIFSMGFDPALVTRALRCNCFLPTSFVQF
jgi:hypothetical protein